MPYERIMGLNVTDQHEYQLYRDAMTPILKNYGGFFAYDFHIAEVIKSRTDEKINRVFAIEFPNEKAMLNFFSDAAYLKVKAKHFEKSVGAVTTISLHERGE